MQSEAVGTQDVRTYARIFWRWRFLFLAFLVVLPLVAYLVERGKPKIYQSSTLVEAQSGTGGLLPITNGNIQAVARLVTTAPVAQRAAQFLSPPSNDPASLQSEVHASANTSTDFVTITAQDHNPYRAAAIATAFAKAIGAYQTAQQRGNIQLQIAALRGQLQAIHSSDSSSRASVMQEIAQLRAQMGATGAGAQVLEPARPNLNPVGPATARAVELAVVIALLLGAGAVLAAESSDRRLRSPEDLEQLTSWPLIGAIPNGAFRPDHAGADPHHGEAFNLLRADLEHFNAERKISSVAVVSPMVGDGKTTVAVGLSLAVARAGRRVILVDADLRRPQISNRLGIKGHRGLSDVLASRAKLDDVMVDFPAPGCEDTPLQVLPAGSPPSNPAALIDSQRMAAVLRVLEGRADLVVVDTAAALAVGDSRPLLRSASGVVLIVRMNRSARAAVRRLQKIVASSRGAVLGVVATGIGPTRAGYGDYYRSYGNRRGDGGGMLGGLRRRSGGTRHRDQKASPAGIVLAAAVRNGGAEDGRRENGGGGNGGTGNRVAEVSGTRADRPEGGRPEDSLEQPVP